MAKMTMASTARRPTTSHFRCAPEEIGAELTSRGLGLAGWGIGGVAAAELAAHGKDGGGPSGAVEVEVALGAAVTSASDAPHAAQKVAFPAGVPQR